LFFGVRELAEALRDAFRMRAAATPELLAAL